VKKQWSLKIKAHACPPGFVHEALEVEKRALASAPFERQDREQIRNFLGLRESLLFWKTKRGKKVLQELIMRHQKPMMRKPIH